jgi:hypothetical protein
MHRSAVASSIRAFSAVSIEQSQCLDSHIYRLGQTKFLLMIRSPKNHCAVTDYPPRALDVKAGRLKV